MSDQIAVATPHHLATQAAKTIHRAGGNVVESVVAAAATLSVVYPHQCSIGGDLFALVRFPDGTALSLNASGPYGSKPIPELDQMPVAGPLTVTVPGAVAGWDWLLREAGSGLPLETVLAPAIASAEDGVPVGRRLSTAISEAMPTTTDPGLRALLTSPDSRPLAFGDILHQPSLGRTLRTLASDGLRDFYEGTVGQALAAAFDQLDIPIERKDLLSFRPVVEEPLTAQTERCRVSTSPPNSQGYLLLTTLLAADELARRSGPLDRRAWVELFMLAESRRTRELADPSVMNVAAAELLSAEAISADVNGLDGCLLRLKPANPHPGRPHGDTVAVTAVAADGTAISLIQSLFHSFGSGIRDPHTGVVFHNRGTFFSMDPTSRNTVHPGRRPAHTLMPVMAEYPDGSISALGAMGGRAQPQIHLQLIDHTVHGAVPAQAVSAPRYVVGGLEAGTRGDVVLTESDLGDTAIAELRRSGLAVRVTDPLDEDLGHAMICTRLPGGQLLAGADPRSDGDTYIAP